MVARQVNPLALKMRKSNEQPRGSGANQRTNHRHKGFGQALHVGFEPLSEHSACRSFAV
jgi:hypothetical protein